MQNGKAQVAAAKANTSDGSAVLPPTSGFGGSPARIPVGGRGAPASTAASKQSEQSPTSSDIEYLSKNLGAVQQQRLQGRQPKRPEGQPQQIHQDATAPPTKEEPVAVAVECAVIRSGDGGGRAETVAPMTGKVFLDRRLEGDGAGCAKPLYPEGGEWIPLSGKNADQLESVQPLCKKKRERCERYENDARARCERRRYLLLEMGFARSKQVDPSTWDDCAGNLPPLVHYPPVKGGAVPVCRRCLARVERREGGRPPDEGAVGPSVPSERCIYCCLNVDPLKVCLVGYAKRAPPDVVVLPCDLPEGEKGPPAGRVSCEPPPPRSEVERCPEYTDPARFGLLPGSSRRDDYPDVDAHFGAGHLLVPVDDGEEEEEGEGEGEEGEGGDAEGGGAGDGEKKTPEGQATTVGGHYWGHPPLAPWTVPPPPRPFPYLPPPRWRAFRKRWNRPYLPYRPHYVYGRQNHFELEGSPPSEGSEGEALSVGASGRGRGGGFHRRPGGFGVARGPVPVRRRSVGQGAGLGLALGLGLAGLAPRRPYSYPPSYYYDDPYYYYPYEDAPPPPYGAYGYVGGRCSRAGRKSGAGGGPPRYLVCKPCRLGKRGPCDPSRFPAGATYVDPYREAPWDDRNLWWYAGENLRRYKPRTALERMMRVGTSLDLPNVMGLNLPVYCGVGIDGKPQRRCEAKDYKTGIRCIYAAAEGNPCPNQNCQKRHYCSREHMLYHFRAKLATLLGCRLKGEEEAPDAFYCPEGDSLWIRRV
jgi:hypothetical protein